MKLPTKKDLADIITSSAISHYVGGTTYELTEYILDKVCSKIIDHIKQIQFDENTDEPEVDPNLVTIAELEAKLAIYEAVVAGAGIKLAIPNKVSEKTEMGFLPPKKEGQ